MIPFIENQILMVRNCFKIKYNTELNYIVQTEFDLILIITITMYEGAVEHMYFA